VADAIPGVAPFLGGPRRNVPRGQVAERGIPAFEVVIAVAVGDLVRRPGLSLGLGTQTRPSLRRLSLISVSFDCCSPCTGMHVG
jgi:hypothetical protein